MRGRESFQLVQASGRQAPLHGVRLVVGRGADAGLQMDDERMSRQHFVLTRCPDGWSIRDLGSTNGTFVNGVRLATGAVRVLVPGDRIHAGQCHWTLEPRTRPAEPAQAGIAAPAREALPSALQPAPAPVGAPAHVVAPRSTSEQIVPAWQWLVSAVLGLGVAFIVIAVFLPWLRVEVKLLVQNLPGGDLLAGIVTTLGEFLGQNGPLPLFEQPAAHDFTGADLNAAVLLIPAALLLVLLAIDLGLRLGRSSLPALGYLAILIVPVAVEGAQLQEVLNAVDKTTFFGKNLLDLVQGATGVVQTRLVPLTGAYLAGIGILLLLAGGIMRGALPLLRRK